MYPRVSATFGPLQRLPRRTQCWHLFDPSIITQHLRGFAFQQRSQGMATSWPWRSIFVEKARRSRARSRRALPTLSVMATAWRKEEDLPGRQRQALALKYGLGDKGLSGRKTSRGGIVSRTNYKRRPGRARGTRPQPIVWSCGCSRMQAGSPGVLATQGDPGSSG